MTCVLIAWYQSKDDILISKLVSIFSEDCPSNKCTIAYKGDKNKQPNNQTKQTKTKQKQNNNKKHGLSIGNLDSRR